MKKSNSTVYYKLTNLKKLENLTLEGIHSAWNECTGYFNNNFEETRFTKIEILFQGISQKISELNFHLNVSKKCQQEQQTQTGLKMLTAYKVSLEGVKNNLKNIVKQLDF